MGGVFVNYRVSDSAVGAAAIADVMARRFGPAQVFRDCDRIQIGERYPDVLRDGLESADVLVAVIGPYWLRITDRHGVRRIDAPHDWVRFEIARAFERGIPVLPVLLTAPPEHTAPLIEADLPDEISELARTQWLTVDQARWGADVDRLMDRLVDLVPTLVIPPLFVAPPSPRTPDSVPSTLLRNEYAVVPFTGRADQLADLRGWARDAVSCSARLVVGPAGSGKTRLARTLCDELVAENWLAGIVSGQTPATHIRQAAGVDRPLLIVVDDAEERAQQIAVIAQAVGELSEQRIAPIRLLLLATVDGEWLRPLRAHTDQRVRAVTGTVTARSTLTLATDRDFRRRQYELARTRFAAALDRPAPDGPPPPMAPTDSLLDVHAAALAAVLDGDGEPAHTGAAALTRILRHDRVHVRRRARARNRPGLDPTYLALVGTLATLCRPDSRDEAEILSVRLPDLLGAADEPVAEYVEWLRLAYPGPYEINPVRPDLLGEHLVAMTLANRPSLATTLAAHATDDQIRNAMTVIGRALRRHPGLGTALVDIIRVAPDRYMTLAVEVATTRLGDAEPLAEALSTVINATELTWENIGAMAAGVLNADPQIDPVRVSLFEQYVTNATKPIRDQALRNAPDVPTPLTNITDNLTDLLMSTAKAFLDPAHQEMPKNMDGEPLIAPDLVTLLRQLWKFRDQ